jgi:putative ATP-binding cassette transporter
MTRQKRLTFFTAGYRQLSVVFPYIVVSPAYYAGKVQLGGLMQTASAFNSVQNALSFFILVYRDLAEWRAVIQRLSGFDDSVKSARALATTPPVIDIVLDQDNARLEIRDLAIRLPNGAPLVAATDVAFSGRDHVLVTGPSGAGKSTLFRAVAGVWPFGQGRVVVPAQAKLMILPQRPYFPIATLAAAITYPAEPGAFPDQQLKEVITAVGLPKLAERLNEEAHWNRMLSIGEQQRLAVARAILQAPDFLFLDEATASLDEPSEANVYRLLQERLKNTTIVSIGHRSTLKTFHHRRIELVRDGEVHRLRDAALQPAAE